MGQGQEEGEFLGPHLTHEAASLPLISITAFLFVLLKHICLLVPSLCPLCMFSMGAKTPFFSISTCSCCIFLKIKLTFFLTCKNITSKFLTLALVAVLMDVRA